jgi:hypothetical protein
MNESAVQRPTLIHTIHGISKGLVFGRGGGLGNNGRDRGDVPAMGGKRIAIRARKKSAHVMVGGDAFDRCLQRYLCDS